MKIGIISDTHGHEMAWANACERFFKGADLILHAATCSTTARAIR